MSKEEILKTFSDINFVYNNASKYDTLNRMLDELESTSYKKLWDRLYNWLNNMRFAIAPDETVTDDQKRNDRLIQVELLDELMEWMLEQEDKQ